MLTPELKITLQGLIHIRDNGPLKPNNGICCNLEYVTKVVINDDLLASMLKL